MNNCSPSSFHTWLEMWRKKIPEASKRYDKQCIYDCEHKGEREKDIFSESIERTILKADVMQAIWHKRREKEKIFNCVPILLTSLASFCPLYSFFPPSTSSALSKCRL